MTYNLFQRIRNKIVHPFDEYFLNYFTFRHPSNFFTHIISKFSFFFRLFQPNDRWNLIIYANEWIKYSKKYKKNNKLKRKF